MVFLEEASQTMLDWVEMSFIHSVQAEGIHRSAFRLVSDLYREAYLLTGTAVKDDILGFF